MAPEEMITVHTSRFGDIDLPAATVITFPEGIIGFPNAGRWVIFECGDEGIFSWLQSCDFPDLAFVICDAQRILPNYQVAVGGKECELLNLRRPEDGVVALIMVIADDPLETTANLLGPIIMNVETRLGMQLALLNPNYTTRYRIFAKNAVKMEEEADNVGA